MIINGGIISNVIVRDQASFVTDNLVQSWDAKSYSGTGNTWSATVGNSATLYNSPTYNAASPTYFNFMPQSKLDYAAAPSIGDLSTWTIEAWFNPAIDLSTVDLNAIVTTVYETSPGVGPHQINLPLGAAFLGRVGHPCPTACAHRSLRSAGAAV